MAVELYRRMAASDGAGAGDGPDRRSLLRRAATEAADFWLPRLSAARRAVLEAYLLSPVDRASPEREKWLRLSLIAWCEARWDGAVPLPHDPAILRLLEGIASNRELPPEPQPVPKRQSALQWVVALGLICGFAVLYVEHTEEKARLAAPRRSEAVWKPPPIGELLRQTLPAAAVRVDHFGQVPRLQHLHRVTPGE
ncbi:MAG: hypothetical protein AB7D00_07525, partial [Rhodospirillaceae bacterium]